MMVIETEYSSCWGKASFWGGGRYVQIKADLREKGQGCMAEMQEIIK